MRQTGVYQILMKTTLTPGCPGFGCEFGDFLFSFVKSFLVGLCQFTSCPWVDFCFHLCLVSSTSLGYLSVCIPFCLVLARLCFTISTPFVFTLEFGSFTWLGNWKMFKSRFVVSHVWLLLYWTQITFHSQLTWARGNEMFAKKRVSWKLKLEMIRIMN